MSTFKEANQVRLMLTMKLFNYSWYKRCVVVPDSDGYLVVVSVRHLDNNVRKLISPVVNGISVKTESE